MDMLISAKSAYVNDLFGLGEHKTQVNGFKWNPKIFVCIAHTRVGETKSHFLQMGMNSYWVQALYWCKY